MKYIYINEKIVCEIVPEFDPIFPNVPITDRYSNAFLDHCVAVEESVSVESGWLYDAEKKTFSRPEAPDIVVSPEAARTVEDFRKEALARIDGKCTAAIYNGYTVNGVHYYFTERAQNDWNGAMIQVLNGATSVSVKIDGNWIVYTADQVKTICGVMKDIIYIMRMYNQQLETWIGRETEKTVLETVHFGSKLPDDLTQVFQKDATDAGVDLTKYASLLA